MDDDTVAQGEQPGPNGRVNEDSQVNFDAPNSSEESGVGLNGVTDKTLPGP